MPMLGQAYPHVVPANAGTHNPGHCCWKKPSTFVLNHSLCGVWVPAFAGTTTEFFGNRVACAGAFCETFRHESDRKKYRPNF